MSKRPPYALVGILWLIAIGVLVLIVIAFPERVAARSGFPYMPRYGAITWWFFFTIPLIGWTWGVFNDLKDRRDR
ncbi:MAG TPA: hypothetical protein VJ803_11730 [Gemmatimonadaceae bacterium]|jgi:hypothetical protein|nr:hypothetical protein [Gemmatimonadaceae bacterium]